MGLVDAVINHRDENVIQTGGNSPRLLCHYFRQIPLACIILVSRRVVRKGEGLKHYDRFDVLQFLGSPEGKQCRHDVDGIRDMNGVPVSEEWPLGDGEPIRRQGHSGGRPADAILQEHAQPGRVDAVGTPLVRSGCGYSAAIHSVGEVVELADSDKTIR
ncbi:MAG: hypothetical protein BWY06_01753 [Candidatus Latescibacteria bacterium ADurb.Bin168]|nr:MAG: hypothetical protein BWY06_01753 [Candidatus Latescibacteria bacterium ADurb.Bin168]